MRERSAKSLLARLPAAIATKLQVRPQWMGAENNVSQIMILGSGASDSVCTSLVIKLNCVAMPPQTAVRTGLNAYILRCGCMCADGSLFTSSARTICFGASDFFLDGADRKFKVPITLLAVTHVELHYFGNKELEAVLAEFPLEAPAIQRRMRWARVFARVMWKAKQITSERRGTAGTITIAAAAAATAAKIVTNDDGTPNPGPQDDENGAGRVSEI
jgi:hypothetical protein